MHPWDPVEEKLFWAAHQLTTSEYNLLGATKSPSAHLHVSCHWKKQSPGHWISLDNQSCRALWNNTGLMRQIGPLWPVSPLLICLTCPGHITLSQTTHHTIRWWDSLRWDKAGPRWPTTSTSVTLLMCWSLHVLERCSSRYLGDQVEIMSSSTSWWELGSLIAILRNLELLIRVNTCLSESIWAIDGGRNLICQSILSVTFMLNFTTNTELNCMACSERIHLLVF